MMKCSKSRYEGCTNAPKTPVLSTTRVSSIQTIAPLSDATEIVKVAFTGGFKYVKNVAAQWSSDI